MKGHLNTSTYQRVDDNVDKKVFSKLKILIDKFKIKKYKKQFYRKRN